MKMSDLRVLPAALACWTALTVCAPPLQAEQQAKEVSQGEAVAEAPAKKGVVGIASYYAKRYNGRRTNSGERHNPRKLTAAHADLPLGTRVRVQNLTNGKEVVVRVNDRCRKKKTPFIDLSREAAKRLGFLGAGTTRVVMSTLPENEID